MARRWTKDQEVKHRQELFDLYIKDNKSISEIAEVLHISEQAVFKRLQRLEINTQPALKEKYLNKRSDIHIPDTYSENLAEFFGIMLGDGHISHFQTVISLGDKEKSYAEYVSALAHNIFKVLPKIAVRKTGYRDVYIGSTKLVSWLQTRGLVTHKVKSQVGVPEWVYLKKVYMAGFVRGFFDTDGSVYKLKFGVQISFTNHSYPLLLSLQTILFKLGYNPSAVSSGKVYLTKISDVKRFFREVKPNNAKHQSRFNSIIA
jgi:intein/homing endonuclease